MENLSPEDRPESPEERKQRRRARRWKRRARMAGPFFGVCAVLGALALSVDLIEYQPEPPKERLSDRPIPESVRERAGSMSARTPSSLSGASVLGSEAMGAPGLLGGDAAAIDVSLAADAALTGDRPAPSSRGLSDIDAPTPPSALRAGR